MLSAQAGAKNLSVDAKTIPVGVNNQIVEKVRFKFGQSARGRSFLSLSDEEDPKRWDIPEDVVAKDKEDIAGRLNMSNFKVSTDPFWFQFGISSGSSSEVLIDTKDQALVMMDKFIQIDMKLPTQKIFGLGER